MSRSPEPHLSSSQAASNTKHTTRCSRHLHTRHIGIICVRRRLIQPASSFDVRLERTKGGITRYFTDTNYEAQAPFSPQLCHAATRQFISLLTLSGDLTCHTGPPLFLPANASRHPPDPPAGGSHH